MKSAGVALVLISAMAVCAATDDEIVAFANIIHGASKTFLSISDVPPDFRDVVNTGIRESVLNKLAGNISLTDADLMSGVSATAILLIPNRLLPASETLVDVIGTNSDGRINIPVVSKVASVVFAGANVTVRTTLFRFLQRINASDDVYRAVGQEALAAGNSFGLENVSATTMDIFRAEPKTLVLQRPELIMRLVGVVKSNGAKNVTDLVSVLRTYPSWHYVDEGTRVSWLQFLNSTLGFSAMTTDPTNAALYPLLVGASISDLSSLSTGKEGAELLTVAAQVRHPAQMQSLMQKADWTSQVFSLLIAIVLILAIVVCVGCPWRSPVTNSTVGDSAVANSAVANSTVRAHVADSSSSCTLSHPIQLSEVISPGQFGAVYRALMDGQSVAVKIFPSNDEKARLSFKAERDVFLLPRLKHENILHFLGVKEVNREYWLVTKYHEGGSLYDFLSCNTVNWTELCHIGLSIARGLAHLHDELPAVAHRDFKSKNVLIRLDTNPMSACISDFGLARIFEPSKPWGNTHYQVGTVRYMAPEVLERTIDFVTNMPSTALASYQRIDMYACGLVLWELATRLNHDGVITASEYKQPFDNVAFHSQEAVEKFVIDVGDGTRPTGPEQWRSTGSPGLKVLRATVEDCWHSMPDGRITAATVKDRFEKMLTFPLPIRIFLYGMPVSAPVRIVRLTLEALNVPYQLESIDLQKGEHLTPEYLKINPQHSIPAIKDGDFCLNESRAIAAYLVNAYGMHDKLKLYPKCPKVRAIVDQRLYFDMGTFYKAFGDIVYPTMFEGRKETPESETNRFDEVLDWANGFVKKSGYVAGTDHLTIADLAFLATYSTIKATGIVADVTKYPELESWFAKVQKEVPNYQKANGFGAEMFGAWYKSKICQDALRT